MTIKEASIFIEAMAGLWSVGVGGEQRLVERREASPVGQVALLPRILLQASHPSRRSTAERLVKMSPRARPCLLHRFGVEANDSVIKLGCGSTTMRSGVKKFIARTGGYHGITIASSSLTGLPTMSWLRPAAVGFVAHVTTPHHITGCQGRRGRRGLRRPPRGQLRGPRSGGGPGTPVAAFIGDLWSRPAACCRLQPPGTKSRTCAEDMTCWWWPTESDQWLRPAQDDVRLRILARLSRISWWCPSDLVVLPAARGRADERQDLPGCRTGRTLRDLWPWVHHKRSSGGNCGWGRKPQDPRGAKPRCKCEKGWRTMRPSA